MASIARASASRTGPSTGEDIDAVLAWLRQHPADGVIATSNPALAHLRTCTPTIQLEGLVDRVRLEGAACAAWCGCTSPG